MDKKNLLTGLYEDRLIKRRLRQEKESVRHRFIEIIDEKRDWCPLPPARQSSPDNFNKSRHVLVKLPLNN